jgi:hypothetical protein
MMAAAARPLDPAALGGFFEQEFDELFDFLLAQRLTEGFRHHAGRVALGDFLVRVDDGGFDFARRLPRQHFGQVRAGVAAGPFDAFQRVAAAAAVVGEDLGAGAAFDFRRCRAGDAGPLADVGGNVGKVLAGDDLGGHRDGGVAVARPRVLDLCLDDAFDGVAVLADFPRRREGVIEVRALDAAGAGLRHRVAAAAVLDEQGAAAGGVGAGRAAAAGHDDGGT